VAHVGRGCHGCCCFAESLRVPIVRVGRIGRSLCAYCLLVLLSVCRGCLEIRRVLLDLGRCLGCLVLLDLGGRRVLLGLDRAGCEIAGDEKV